MNYVRNGKNLHRKRLFSDSVVFRFSLSVCVCGVYKGCQGVFNLVGTSLMDTLLGENVAFFIKFSYRKD